MYLVHAVLLITTMSCGLYAQDGRNGTATSDSKSTRAVLASPRPHQDRNELPLGEDPDNHLFVPFAKHLVDDQKQFWTEPSRLRIKDLRWAVPLVGISTALIASDSWISKQVPDKPNQLKRSKDISNYTAYSLIGVGGASFVLGHLHKNDRLAEAGLLSGEAAINATAVDYVMKSISRRERPYQGDGNGTFFKGGSSFASEHSAAAWSVASVWAHEYPSTLSQIFAYGLASTVTFTRVTSKQHFPSDAVIGSALGWYFGRQVYRAHHDKELGGAAWGPLLEDNAGERSRNPANMGSPYVRVDNWVYPLLDRLSAMGYIHSGYSGMRPWTRLECARLLEEAGEKLQSGEGSGNAEAEKMYDALTEEFAPERRRLEGASNIDGSVDSIYTRFTGISGPPLRDGYHFGQTITNDYGRPYGEGINNVTGVTAHAVAGPFAISFQGEYQHAPAVASARASVLQQIANADLTLPLSNGFAAVDRFEVLDSAVSFQFHNMNFSFGKQSLWLGPSQTGSLLLSNNAEPIPMFRIDSVSPYRITGLSRILGPVRTEYFVGQLSGHTFEFNGQNGQLIGPADVNPQPFLTGIKVSTRPTPNLELGFGMTAQFVGPGLPFTWHNYFRALYSHTAGTNNPGKRISSADFSYRLPGLRNWLTIYADTLVVDEYSPIGSSRAMVNPGFQLSHLPKLASLQFRAEGLNQPLHQVFLPGFFYYGARRYRSGYTNNGNLLGSWIGRAGRGGQGWMTYWFSRHENVELGYRLQEVSSKFLGGGRSADYMTTTHMLLTRALEVSGSVQYERWYFPLLHAGSVSSVTASFRLTYRPKLGVRE